MQLGSHWRPEGKTDILMDPPIPDFSTPHPYYSRLFSKICKWLSWPVLPDRALEVWQVDLFLCTQDTNKHLTLEVRGTALLPQLIKILTGDRLSFFIFLISFIFYALISLLFSAIQYFSVFLTFHFCVLFFLIIYHHF